MNRLSQGWTKPRPKRYLSKTLVLYREWTPFVSKVENTTIEGIYADIWQILESRLNFSTVITPIPVKTSKWSYMTKSIANREFDLVLTGNSQTFERSSITDFSFPLAETSLRMIYLRSAETTNWMFYANSFLPETWAAILGSWLIFFLVFASLLFLAKQVKGDA